MNSVSPLGRIRVVLSHPSHPGNIGAAARAMKTMGLSRLYLVDPRHFPDPEAEARASGAADLLAQAVVCPTLEQALADTVFAVGMSARRRDLSLPFCWAREGAAQLAQRASSDEVALVFGNETSGLTNEELSLCHQPVMIPADPDYSSLNLGAAVQLMCYELRLAALSPGAPASAAELPLATGAEVEGLYAHLERCALASGFLDPSQPKRLMLRFRRLFARTALEREEVSILRGLLASFERPKLRKKS
ncbi:tRNA (cytidine/uridine-2'-O-)-methyltransferase TrmJ [mine drainage metagenome]|uniref:tRNA (Cytidine/uridine-2'-O-)-methyltransferase TrmJ n=1 Tax=mine drainage metagenome TaxID=410659 RepID=A0A1J5SES4_9ZZZZ